MRAMTIGWALAAALGLVSPALAQTDPARPWEAAGQLLKQGQVDIQAGGIQSVGRHLSEMEAALASARQAEAAGLSAPDKVYVLADGPAVALVVMAAARQAAPGREIVAVADPYPGIGFYLGSYYNEVGQGQTALRVLDAALAADSFAGLPGEMAEFLIPERGAALGSLRRLQDALATYDQGLKLPNLSQKGRARMLRGKGFALTDLNRLDEAEAAYKESLTYDPGNDHALHELDYIRQVRAGAGRGEAVLALPGQKIPGE